jgi:hypothetical protein
MRYQSIRVKTQLYTHKTTFGDFMRSMLLFATVGLMFTACGKNRVQQPKPVNTEKLAEKERKGYPDWITNPYTKGFEPANSVCASAQSTMGLASGNIDAARSDAEIQVKNRVAEQVQAEVGLLQERSNEIFRDMSGKEVGGTTLKVINQNYQETKIVGLRYLSTYYHPDPISPEKVFVLGCIRVDFIDLAKQIQEQMMSAAQTQEAMEFEHQEAMLRFDEVRRQYLGQKGVTVPSAETPILK